MGNSSKTVKSMSLGNMFAQSGTMNSREATGELSRIEFCLQPGRSTARLFEISLRTTTTPTMPSMPGRCVQMTKREPDQVIEYRISLQDKLNEQVDSALAAYQINKVATPLVALLSDTSAMLLITGLLEATGIIDLDKGILREIADGLYENYGDAMKAYLMDPVDLAINPLDLGTGLPMDIAEKAAPTVIKAWVWMMTTGRVLITEKT